MLLDRLVNKGIVMLDPVREAVAALPRCRGSRLARGIVALADGWAESPPESRLRLLLLRAGSRGIVTDSIASSKRGGASCS